MSEKKTQRELQLDPEKIENFEHYLFEYFYVFGITPEIIYNEDIGVIRDNVNSNKIAYKKLIVPELISRFPPCNKPLICMDEKVILSHAFPLGYNIANGETEPQNEIFHFSLDNFISYDYNKKIYFTVYIIYEPYSKIIKTIKKYKTTQFAQEKKRKNYKRKNSFSKETQFYNNYYTTIKSRPDVVFYKYDDKKYQRRRSYSKIFYKPEFDITLYDHDLKKANQIFFPKALVMSSLTAYPDIHEKVLKNLNNIILKGSSDVPIEKHLETLFTHVLYLPKNQSNVFVQMPNGNLLIKQRCINELPSPNYKMGYLFTFTLDALVQIFKNILLEIPTLFFGKDKNVLTNLFETFSSFLFPFRYQYPNCSILPKENYAAIVREKTFFFGINQTYNSKFFLDNNICLKGKKIFIVDIDKKKVIEYFFENENNPIIIFTKEEEVKKDEREINFEKLDISGIGLPDHAKKKMKEKINEGKANYEDKNYSALREGANIKISNSFFYFFMLCFGDYLKYMYLEKNEIMEIFEIIHTAKKIPIEKLFKVDLFLKTKSKSDQTFYLQFINTQM